MNPPRSSAHEFVQRCVPLNSGCLFVSKWTFTTYSTCRQCITMFLLCFRLRSPGPLDSSPQCDPERHLRQPSGGMASQAFVHFLLSQVLRLHVGGIFDSPTLSTLVSSRRATASCTHKTWVWRCLTRSTPRLEAIAFDAVASSTCTRGFTTFAMSAAMATAPRAPDALLVNA